MISDDALDVLFRNARSQNGWTGARVTDARLRQMYELLKWGPTSANSCPARFIFLRSTDAKERLRPYLNPGNVPKSMSAPVIAIVGYDLLFYEHLSSLFPHDPKAPGWFVGEENREAAEIAAFRNGTMQGAYLILAARAVGLDCGPMSGFDGNGVDREFWQGTSVRTNFLCNLGHGDPSKVFGRLPRLAFDQACRIV
ncbi:MAG: malonic semialdehyde reductase [Casimicrobiaceae bacterium]